MERKVRHMVRGYRTQDGAGVSLVRVLGSGTVNEFDPVLLLDSFDSINPDEYTAGFPMHPHRGIETISYVFRGRMTHRDSLGNEDTISDGEVQWMTAGSGILHEEKLPASERMLGVQLWLNLPAKDKMGSPAYLSIKNNQIREIPLPGGKLRLLAGSYEGTEGYRSRYLPLDYYDIHINKGTSVTVRTERNRSVLLFTLSGKAVVGGESVSEKTAVKLSSGDYVEIGAEENGVQVLLVSSAPLNEPVAWGGPIVMNTQEELDEAFDDLRRGTFLQKNITYS